MEHPSALAPFMNKILMGDTVETLQSLPDNTADLIFADPPYNLQLRDELWRPNQTKVKAVSDEWDRFSNFREYDEFSLKWLTECRRVLKKDGSIWVIGTYHNIFRIGKIMQDLGFWIINDIIWIKTNPMPNFRGTRFTNAHETLIFAAKSIDSKYSFHYKSMRAYNDDVQMRSDWEIPICSGSERIKINGRKAHSTQKPEELLKRIIIASSNPGDIVLDPFFGSGTTGAVAKLLRRNFIGIERREDYVGLAEERISKVVPLEADLISYPLDERPVRVPFGNLVSARMIAAGETIFSADMKNRAIVLANGTVKSGNISGSIHHVSAVLQGKQNYNGWSYWYVLRDNNLVSIDHLRNEYRKNASRIAPPDNDSSI